MNHEKKVIRKLRNLRNKDTETFNEYKRDLNVFLTRYGYVADVYECLPSTLWH